MYSVALQVLNEQKNYTLWATAPALWWGRDLHAGAGGASGCERLRVGLRARQARTR